MNKQFTYQHNHCEGWYQASVHWIDGSTSNSARFNTKQGVMDAIRFHYKHDMWPREFKEKPVEVCEACGQPLPEDDD